MPIRDTAAMNASLDNDYGPTRGPNAAASHDVALYSGDPMIPADQGGGVEIDGGGYARVPLAAADWEPADAGAKSAAPVTFPDTTAAWATAATHWALFDGAVMWDCGPLAEELVVTGPGSGPVVEVTVFYADSLNDMEE